MFENRVSVLSYLRKEMKPMFLHCSMFIIIEMKDLFGLISRSFCGHDKINPGGFRSFSLPGRCETTEGSSCMPAEEARMKQLFCFDLFRIW